MPRRMWRLYLLITRSCSGPKWRKMLEMEPPGTYSMKMVTTVSSKDVPKYPTILTCFSVFSKSTSSCNFLYSFWWAAGWAPCNVTCLAAMSSP
ncbi:hypothetical protein GDO78_014926 [Eleutherodactylus coqui]|uniref:Uncharacterized protein n=1 Tax=Eleutherodactylus coqui TaxID=57060 RepID=A0A8J6B139_ELECQ|nr:hypothetical protein GDO78_014926 [Eleutherodactylus coqui]